jgi:hypothetical protein
MAATPCCADRQDADRRDSSQFTGRRSARISLSAHGTRIDADFSPVHETPIDADFAPVQGTRILADHAGFNGTRITPVAQIERDTNRGRSRRRSPTTRWCYGKGPMQTFFDSVSLAKEKQVA